MLIGYARVSTQDQTLDLQKDALNKLGCSRIFTDMASGAQVDRPGLEEALTFMREGDSLIVWRLDRLGRSLQNLLAFLSELKAKDVVPPPASRGHQHAGRPRAVPDAGRGRRVAEAETAVTPWACPSAQETSES